MLSSHRFCRFVVIVPVGLMLLSSIGYAQSGASASDASVGREPAEPIGAVAKQEPFVPLWEFGFGAVAVDQQAYPGSSVRTRRGLVTPYFIYRGPLLRAENGNVGIRAIRNDRIELDIGAAGSFGSRSNVPLRDGMPEIGTLGEIGPRLRIRLGNKRPNHSLILNLPLRLVFNLSRQFRYTGLAFEPRISYGYRFTPKTVVSLNGSLLFSDRRLATTLYGVDSQFATATRPAFQARSGFAASRISTSIRYDINRYWRITGFARLDSVAGAANRRSPLIDQETGYTFGIRIGWTMAESKRPGAR